MTGARLKAAPVFNRFQHPLFHGLPALAPVRATLPAPPCPDRGHRPAAGRQRHTAPCGNRPHGDPHRVARTGHRHQALSRGQPAGGGQGPRLAGGRIQSRPHQGRMDHLPRRRPGRERSGGGQAAGRGVPGRPGLGDRQVARPAHAADRGGGAQLEQLPGGGAGGRHPELCRPQGAQGVGAQGHGLPATLRRLSGRSRPDRKDLKVVNLDWPGSKAAVVNRDIDATFGGADLHLLLDKGVTLPVSTKGKGPAFSIYASLLATDDFITRYPAHTTRLVKQLIRASQWASDEANRAALLQLWGEQSGQGEAVFKAEFDGESLKSRHSPRIDEAAVSVYKNVAADGLKLGLIKQPVDVEAWVAPQFVEAALKELKAEKFWPALDRNGRPLP